jgi:hypothetical protein
VCEEAARAPAAVDPAFTMMTGFLAVTSRETRRKRMPSSMLSTSPRMTRVSGSFERNSMTSDSVRAALLPRLTNFEKPTFSPIAQSRMAVHSAPDCEKKEIAPAGGVPAAKDALRRACVLMRPRQLGPSTLTFAFRAVSRRARSSPRLPRRFP